MRTGMPFRPRWLLPVLGLVLGSAAGVATVALASTAIRQSDVTPRAVLDATHLPPLLTVDGEKVDLAYDVHCAAAGVEEAETGCDVRGTVFVRAAGGGSFDEIALVAREVEGQRQLTTTIPDSVASQPGGFEYYAVLEAPELGERITVPAGGADAPHASRRMESSVDVSLGRHVFGAERRAGTRLAFSRWGDGPADVGLEQGRNLGPIGASAFDVDASGTVFVLDQAHRRLLRWRKGADAPDRVPVSVAGTLADMAVGNDGSVYILETVGRPGRNPLVRRFDDAGRELEAVETAERTPSQIRMTPKGPTVLGQPSHQWMPLTVDGTPASPSEQLRRGRLGRALRGGGGGDVVVFRHENELRITVTAGRGGTRSWRLTSSTPLAEVQFADALGQRLVVVVRLYDDRNDEFAVLILDRTGLVSRFALESADWAESAPLGRFKLVGRFLYRLGSTSAGAFVDRFDLEVR